MKKINKYTISLLFVAVALFSIMSVNAAISCSVNSPTDGSFDKDSSVDFQITCTGFTANITNDACTLNFSGTNPGSNSYTATATNTTDTTMVCSHTLSTMSDQTYQWTMTLTNGTDSSSSTQSSVNVDVTTSAGKAALLIQMQENLVQPEGGASFSITEPGLGGIPTFVWAIIIIAGIVAIVKYKK